MRNVAFNYSLDGTTFQTAITLKCLAVRCYAMPSFESQSSEQTGMTATASECQIATTRLHLDILISSVNFDAREVTAATAASNLLFIEKWQCAQFRRIYNVDVATDATFDGWNNWDSSATNTVYLNIDTPNRPEYKDMESSTRSIKDFKLNCYTRDAITL